MPIGPLSYKQQEYLGGPEASKYFQEAMFSGVKDVYPYVKYADPSEVDRFLELSQQQQTRELLFENLKLQLELGGGRLLEGVGKLGKKAISPVIQKILPKTMEKAKDLGKYYTPKGGWFATKGPDDLPKYAGSINLEKQNIPKHLKMAELRANEGVKKTKLTWTEIDKQGNKILENSELIDTIMIKASRDIPLDPIERDVVRKMEVEGLYRFQGAIDSITNVQEAQSVFEAFNEQIFIPSGKSATQAGRGLNVFRKEVGLIQVSRKMSKLDRVLNERELKAFKNLDLNNVGQVKQFMNELGDPKIMDYVYEYWYNSILSGIPTHVVNIASNTAWRMFQVPHRLLSGSLDALISKFTGKQRTRFASEAIPLMAGMVKAKPKAAINALDMLKHGKITSFETKWAQEMGSAVGAFDRSPSQTVRIAGKFITPPTKALRAMDVYANTLAYDGQMMALAKRAWIKGGKRGKFKKFAKEFVENPSDKAHEEAMEFAKYTTFMSDPGKFSEWIMRGRDVVPGGRFVVPFVNTIGNLLKRGSEMTPGLGILLAKNQNPAEVVAKQLEGLLAFSVLYKKFADGEMTGPAPENRAENEAFYRQGKKAWAIKLGDNWYQYRRVEPFNTVFASAYLAYRGIGQALAEDNDDEATRILGKAVNDFKNNLIDSSYLQGVSQLLDRYGTIERAPKRMASSLVPYSGFWRSVNRSWEAHVEGAAKYRPGDTWVSAFANVIPGLYEKTDSRLDVWGKEVELEGGVFRQWLPYKWSKGTEDVTEMFLEELGIYPGLPSQKFKHNNNDLRFDDDIYRQFVVDFGSVAKKKLDQRVKSYWGSAVLSKSNHKNLTKKVDDLLTEERNRARGKAINEQIKRERLK
jgi:hypothetical protein